jgi:tetratricopeptide (TPR) repeat protein
LSPQPTKLSGKIVTFSVKVLNIIPSIDPSYEQRWYWHRDLGLCYYHQQKYEDAAEHYSIAAELRKNDSELFRFAGDSYYYEGNWLAALSLYERAMELESTEKYYLRDKIEFINNQNLISKPRYIEFRGEIALKFEAFGKFLYNKGLKSLSLCFFRAATRIGYFIKTANDYLALYYNNMGQWPYAIKHLQMALYCIPEDPVTRANLALNKYFITRVINNEIKGDIKASFFHGDSSLLEIYKIALIKNPKKNEILSEIRRIGQIGCKKRRDREKRRRKLREPEIHDGIVHIEF